MDETKFKTAMVALTDLMRSELDGDDRHKFARIGRITVLAQKLQMEGNPRPEDMDQEGAMMGMDPYGGYGAIMPGRAVPMLGAGNDQQQMVREMLGVLGPQLTASGDASRARVRADQARELNDLMMAHRMSQTGDDADPAMAAQLQKRIKTLTAQMSAEEEEEIEDGKAADVPVHPGPDVHVVHPFHVRGREIGEGI